MQHPLRRVIEVVELAARRGDHEHDGEHGESTWTRRMEPTTSLRCSGSTTMRKYRHSRTCTSDSMNIRRFVLVSVLLVAAGAFGFRYLPMTSVHPDPVTAEATPVLASSGAPAEPEWTRPPGPLRVALQAGHWKAAEAPDEQAGLRDNGTRWGNRAEWQVNLAIAEHAAELLKEAGYEVEILPTTIPPAYYADLFISIHADGHTNTSISGYRAAAPRRDRTGRAAEFAELLMDRYGKATGLRLYPTVTRRMTSYYAFNSRRYEHALHPMTVGVILETGFLTSARDRAVIVNQPDRAARGIAEAVIHYLGPVSPSAGPASR